MKDSNSRKRSELKDKCLKEKQGKWMPISDRCKDSNKQNRCVNSPRSILYFIFLYFGMVFFVLKSFLGIARQQSRQTFVILTLKPRSDVRIFVYRTWAIQ